MAYLLSKHYYDNKILSQEEYLERRLHILLNILSYKYGEDIPEAILDSLDIQNLLVEYYSRVVSKGKVSPDCFMTLPSVFSLTSLCEALKRTKNISGIYTLAMNVQLTESRIMDLANFVKSCEFPLKQNIFLKHLNEQLNSLKSLNNNPTPNVIRPVCR